MASFVNNGPAYTVQKLSVLNQNAPYYGGKGHFLKAVFDGLRLQKKKKCYHYTWLYITSLGENEEFE